MTTFDATISASCQARSKKALSKHDMEYRPRVAGKEIDCFDMRILDEYYTMFPDRFGWYPPDENMSPPTPLPDEICKRFVKWARDRSSDVLKNIQQDLKRRRAMVDEGEEEKHSSPTVQKPCDSSFGVGMGSLLLKPDLFKRDSNHAITHVLSITDFLEEVDQAQAICNELASQPNEFWNNSLELECIKAVGLGNMIDQLIANQSRLASNAAPLITLADFRDAGVKICVESAGDMIVFTSEHVLIMDYDFLDSTTDEEAAKQQIRDRLLPLLNKLHKIEKLTLGRPMEFLVFQTERGNLHIICISHKHNPKSIVSLLWMCLLQGDFAHAAFTPIHGFNVRAGPKSSRYSAVRRTYQPDRFLGRIFYSDNSYLFTSRWSMETIFSLYSKSTFSLYSNHQDKTELVQFAMLWMEFQQLFKQYLHNATRALANTYESKAYEYVVRELKNKNGAMFADFRQLVVQAKRNCFGWNVAVSHVDFLTPEDESNPTRSDLIAAIRDMRGCIDTRIFAITGEEEPRMVKAMVDYAKTHMRETLYEISWSLLETQLKPSPKWSWITSTKETVQATFMLPLNGVLNALAQGLTRKKSKHMLIPMQCIIQERGKSPHSTAFVINSNPDEIVLEHFDSHGLQSNVLVRHMMEDIRAQLVEKIESLHLNKPVRLLSPEMLCGVSSRLQQGQRDFMCRGYSTLYLQLRLLFPERPPTTLIDWFLGPNGADIRDEDQRLEFMKLYSCWIRQQI